MNIINVGDPRTISLAAGQTVSVTTTGTITVDCVSGLGLTAGSSIGSVHGSRVFGSFTADGVIRLTATGRDGAYEVNTDTSRVVESTTGATGQNALDDTSRVALAASGVNLGASLSVINLKASNTTITRNLLASSGYTRGIIQVVGDSYPQGRGSLGNTDVGARAQAWPIQMASFFTAAGHTVKSDTFCGWGSVTPSTIDGVVAYDPRISYTGTVTKYSGIAGLGYEMFQLAAGATLTFTPGGTFDTIDVFYAAKASGATSTFTVSDAGGVKATIDCNVGTAAIQTTSVTLAAGTTAVTFTGGAAASTLSFAVARTAALPYVDLINCGQAGKPVQQWAPTAAAAPYGTQASLNLLDGSLNVATIIDGWYNDLKTPRTLAQFQTDLRALCSWAKSKGDLWYFNYAKLNPAQVDEATFQLWSQAAISIVVNEYDGVVVDMSKIMPDNAAALTQGLINADLLHLKKGGHTLVARTGVNAMLSCLSLG